MLEYINNMSTNMRTEKITITTIDVKQDLVTMLTLSKNISYLFVACNDLGISPRKLFRKIFSSEIEDGKFESKVLISHSS